MRLRRRTRVARGFFVEPAGPPPEDSSIRPSVGDAEDADRNLSDVLISFEWILDETKASRRGLRPYLQRLRQGCGQYTILPHLSDRVNVGADLDKSVHATAAYQRA
jgi:hypothetical protein